MEKRVLFEWYIPPAELPAPIVITRFEKSMMQLNKHPYPEIDGFYMILGKLHFWDYKYGLFKLYSNIYAICIRIHNSSLLSDQQEHKAILYIVKSDACWVCGFPDLRKKIEGSEKEALNQLF